MLPTPIDKKVRFSIDFGSILGPYREPESMRNRIKKSVENRWPKKSTKRGLKSAPATSGPTTSWPRGPLGRGGGCKHPDFQNPPPALTQDLTRRWAVGPANFMHAFHVFIFCISYSLFHFPCSSMKLILNNIENKT